MTRAGLKRDIRDRLAIGDDHAMDVKLNDRQRAVLDWIAEGCPDGVYEDEGHKVSAAALRARSLVAIRGRGPTWNAELTDRGRAFLADPPPPLPARPRDKPAPTPVADREPKPSTTRAIDRPPTKTEQLVADVIAAGDRLVLPDETAKGGVNWRQRAYAAQRHGKVPDGKRLVVSRGHEGFVVELMDGQTGNELGAEEIHVPARLTKYHRVAREFRDRTDLQQISRKAVPRALRIIHALAVEIERRGHGIECANAPQTDQYGRRERGARDSVHLVVTIKDHDLELRVYEKGVGLRSAWEQEKAYYEENRLNFQLGYLPSRPTAYDKDATGQLNISLLCHGPRRTTWGDRKRWKLDDRLGQILRELETQAVEAERPALRASAKKPSASANGKPPWGTPSAASSRTTNSTSCSAASGHGRKPTPSAPTATPSRHATDRPRPRSTPPLGSGSRASRPTASNASRRCLPNLRSPTRH